MASQPTSPAPPVEPAASPGPVRPRRPAIPADAAKRRKLGLLLAVAVVVALALVPLLGLSGSLLFSFSTVFMYIAVTSSWNLISGFTGYIDFGHAVFFGIGAYTTGILMFRLDWPFWPTLPVALLVSAVFALLVGAPLLRLRGVYFSIAMLGAFMAVRELTRIVRFTGGSAGLTLPPIVNRPLFFYTFLTAAVLMVALTWWLRQSQLGFSLLAIREDEEGAEARGINTTALKLLTFCTSAAVTSVLGGIWAYQTTFIDPNIVFREVFLINIALMTVLGGLGTVWGPVVGTVLFISVRDTIWAGLADQHLLLFGIVLIIVVLFMPEGVLGTLERGERTVLGRRIQRWRRERARAAAGEAG